jgi:uncharacterized membrane protein
MRTLLIVIAALLGAAFASGSLGAFGAALAGLAAYALIEIQSLKRRTESLERELTAMRRLGPVQRSAEPAAPAERSAVAADEGEAFGERPEGLAAREQAFEASRAVPIAQSAQIESEPERPAAAPIAAQASHERIPPEENPIVRAVREWFTGGNTLVRIGVVILFIGVAFLLRYVAERTHVPIEFRLSGVAAGAVVLLALGWRLRHRRAGYALALQGGAIGILYLTVFASLRLFSVLPPGPAFLLLVLLAAFSAALGILQNSLAFSLLSVSCGFLAPVLASTGQGNHVVLFSYYGVLNLAILAIAWFKAWRPLNVAGFAFTFVIGTAWGVLRYRPEHFWSTEPFLIGFFVLYVVIAVLFSIRQTPALRGYVDGTIVFGVPVVAFGLQSALVHDKPFALAYSAAGASAMYLGLAWLLHKGQRDTQRLLVEAFMALGVVFLTLSVPLALDGRWSAATWALEGAALVWIGCRQDRRLPRAFGALLQIASGVLFLYDANSPHGKLPILNSLYLGGVMIAVGSVFATRMLRSYEEQLRNEERFIGPVLFVWGLFWWLGSGIGEIVRQVSDRYVPASILVLFAVTALICSELKRRFDLPAARTSALMLLPVMVAFATLTALASLESQWRVHPLEYGGWIAWPLAFAVFYLVCRRHEEEGRIGTTLHVASAWLLVILATWEFAWQVDRAVAGSGSWPAIAWAIVPGVALYLLPKLRSTLQWPVAAHAESYVAIAGAGIAVALMAWSLLTNLSMRGDPHPLPYVPLLNPLDLAQAFVLLVLIRHWLHLQKERYPLLRELTWKQAAATLAALAFIWLNAVLLRTLHHWAGVPFDFDQMLSSTLVQTSLSIFWTVLALTTMVLATRFASRIVWIAGVALLPVVILKLLFVDLSRVGTVERIVSFVVVGVLFLVVGYFSPVPPAREERA